MCVSVSRRRLSSFQNDSLAVGIRMSIGSSVGTLIRSLMTDIIKESEQREINSPAGGCTCLTLHTVLNSSK